ncbi:MAG: metallophosphoesterase [Lachnospiraceae bacterium]|nr:metallophosphoesterase [Lachnospiraceae bacterium]
MIAIFLSPLYLLLNLYLVRRLLEWFATLHGFLGRRCFVIPFTACYVLVCLTPLSAAFLRGRIQVFTKRISNYWFGTLMYLLILMLVTELIRILFLLFHHQKILTPVSAPALRIGGAVILVLTVLISIYGICHANHIKRTSYKVSVSKESSLPGLKIALVADLHLGYSVNDRQISQMVRMINSMQPDLIVLAGDIFDNDFDTVQNPEQIRNTLLQMKSTYGAYACWGNHDIDELILAGFTFAKGDKTIRSDPRMDQFLEDSGIRLLTDQSILIDNAFYLTGRRDLSTEEKSGLVRSTPAELAAGLDSSLPMIVIDHQPAELQELADAGFDLDLSGHTHDGQLFPGTLVTRLRWENSCGMLEKDRMTSIVTSGVGVWGPAMRVGTDCEVVEICINFL